jgi:ABC-type sulfate transport system permease subunit
MRSVIARVPIVIALTEVVSLARKRRRGRQSVSPSFDITFSISPVIVSTVDTISHTQNGEVIRKSTCTHSTKSSSFEKLGTVKRVTVAV